MKYMHTNIVTQEMKKLHKALFIGAIAGLIDVTPMILMNLNWYACASAFLQWCVLGIIISYLQFPGLSSWLKGLIVAELCALPIIVLVAQQGMLDVVPILLMSALLGSFVGWSTERYAK